MARSKRTTGLSAVAALVLALVYYLLVGEWPDFAGQAAAPSPAAAPVSAPQARPASDDDAIDRAFRERRSDLWVNVGGVVAKTLADDRDGSPHQRFIVRLDSGRTLLVAHNIELAQRVPLREGDPVALRGEYEWNERGGVVHWTHHDPDGRRQGGFIEYDGKRYR